MSESQFTDSDSDSDSGFTWSQSMNGQNWHNGYHYLNDSSQYCQCIHVHNTSHVGISGVTSQETYWLWSLCRWVCDMRATYFLSRKYCAPISFPQWYNPSNICTPAHQLCRFRSVSIQLNFPFSDNFLEYNLIYITIFCHIMYIIIIIIFIIRFILYL